MATASYIDALSVSSSNLGYSRQHEEETGTFFKYLEDIYTPALCEVEAHSTVLFQATEDTIQF